MKRWHFWLGLVISAFFLYWAFSKIEWLDFWASIRDANYLWLIPGIAVYFIGVWIRAWRWHYLLSPIKKIPTQTMFPITAIGYMGNNIYPARAGEVLRAVILNSRENVSISSSLATIIAERIFDGVVMLGFIFINLPELASLTGDAGLIGNIQQVALFGTGIFSASLALFLLAAIFPLKANELGQRVIRSLLPARLHTRLGDLLNKFLGG